MHIIAVLIRLCLTTIIALLGLLTGEKALPSQQAILFVEDTSNPYGKAYYGLATWRNELAPSKLGKAETENVIVAQVAIPEPRMVASLILRQITDQSPTGHQTIEISFKLPATFPGGGINTVPGVLMKVSQGRRGTPLVGSIEKTKDSSFLVDLSSDDAEKQHNLQLLRDLEWLDIPIVYNNGQRAILTLEKGRSGDHAFAEAFTAWKN